MVVIHFKKSDANQFLFTATCPTPIEELKKQLVLVNNLRLKVDRLAVSLEDLAAKGPLKPEALRGLQNLDDYVKSEDHTVLEGLKLMPPKVGTREVTDESYYRTGFVLDMEITQKMLDTAAQAKKVIHVDQIQNKVYLTEEMLREQIDNIRGIIMMSYPTYHGLGEWEPVRVLLEDKEEFFEQHNTDDLDPDTASMWFAGKELVNGKTLGDYTRNNEKTKIVLKIQGKGQGPPVREPLIDKDTHTKMMSFYHKKQEEQKQLEEDNEDVYLNSAWANPKALKAQLHGHGDVKWR